MKKLFISQPMNGKTEKEILEERRKIIDSVKATVNDEIVVLESYFEDYNPEAGCVPLKYLAKSIELLADADIACFVEGWENARGCLIEYECAVKYGIEVWR